ncbi:ATPase [Methylobacterium dankookense]|uniref:Uncharacterized protein n=1 Tax=Methylobacterium dankookense TaxID=560405 RepID=A0A564G3D3_9HYPH|nr:ATPase [Methylobacterium dankookense]GJD56790.1 hypothetical protein IFDJLNFL_2687 [Methylobacterium dankookense]VUF15009.1 hypothetical protein MTDSW087_04738 [Methylobacterium dankookense]
MSEPARHVPPSESGHRSASGSLRDWLAAMRMQTQAAAPGLDAQPEPRPARPEPSWSPRLVEPAPPPPRESEPEDSDISDLMAENLMLQAKLRVEGERQEALQELLAQEIRSLRGHVQQEMDALQAFRVEREQILAERDALRGECARLSAERDAMRAERDKAETERDGLRLDIDRLREDGELWRARAEALAQPLFQTRR